MSAPATEIPLPAAAAASRVGRAGVTGLMQPSIDSPGSASDARANREKPESRDPRRPAIRSLTWLTACRNARVFATNWTSFPDFSKNGDRLPPRERKIISCGAPPPRPFAARSRLPIAILIASWVLALSPIPAAFAQQVAAVNRGVVELETTGSDGISVRIAEDIARLVNDSATRRVVPVVGNGSLQNITDLKYLHGIDVAIVQADVLDYAKEQHLFPGVESSLTYITKLYNEEFHLLARPEIKSITDLAGQKVNVDLLGTGTAITATRLFEQLKLQVTATHDSPQVALDKLRNGEIAALAFVAGKPAPLFAGLSGDDGLHFVSVPFDPASTSVYAPTRLTAADYPGLVRPNQAVDTLAVGSVLLAADLRQTPVRYNNVANFVDVFFTGFQSLLSRGNHPKWSEVNIAAEVPGWHRYDPAAQWLQQNAQVAGVQDPDKLKAMFSRFIDERRQSIGAAPMTDAEKNALFQQFKTWRGDQGR